MKSNQVWLLRDLIEKNQRQFKIPVYQGNYDWISTQCEKLYSDIIHTYKNDKKHFTGTIVYINANIASSRLQEALIIDTTIKHTV